MLEDYLLNNKIIRSYAKIFNDKDFNKVMRYTVILGIQTLKEEVPNFNQLSAQEIENLIVESVKGDYPAQRAFERYEIIEGFLCEN